MDIEAYTVMFNCRFVSIFFIVELKSLILPCYRKEMYVNLRSIHNPGLTVFRYSKITARRVCRDVARVEQTRNMFSDFSFYSFYSVKF